MFADERVSLPTSFIWKRQKRTTEMMGKQALESASFGKCAIVDMNEILHLMKQDFYDKVLRLLKGHKLYQMNI